MQIIKKYDPVTLAKYDIKNKLTENSIWKWSNWYTKNFKKLKWMINNLLDSKKVSRGVK